MSNANLLVAHDAHECKSAILCKRRAASNCLAATFFLALMDGVLANGQSVLPSDTTFFFAPPVTVHSEMIGKVPSTQPASVSRKYFKSISLAWDFARKRQSAFLSFRTQAGSNITKKLQRWRKQKDVVDESASLETQCGSKDDSTDVEAFVARDGTTYEFVMAHQISTGQLKWNNDLSTHFPQDSGNVAGKRICSGTLITEKHFLTAAHCFDINGGGQRTPRKLMLDKLVPVPPSELAVHMRVNFNNQRIGITQTRREEASFPVVSLVEYRSLAGGHDYAIVELGKGLEGVLPGRHFPPQLVDATATALQRLETLVLFHHPFNQPKRVSIGKAAKIVDARISYGDLDTEYGSSGAGVINQSGRLVAVHTNGGCSRMGGENFGVTLEAIRKDSTIVRHLSSESNEDTSNR